MGSGLWGVGYGEWGVGLLFAGFAPGRVPADGVSVEVPRTLKKPVVPTGDVISA